MDTIIKKQISERLKDFCEQKGSQNKASNALNGVSSATISHVLNDNWELIKDTMWRNIASQIGFKRNAWNTVETSTYREIMTILSEAQENSLVFALTGNAGCGKTLALKQYEEVNSEVYVLSCNEYWNRKMFLIELANSMGRDVTGLTVGDMMNDVVRALKTNDYPLIVMDEADKLSDQVLYFFITLYNKLEDHCGIILIATDHLEKKIRNGVRHSRKGYKEIFSRVGRKFVALSCGKEMDIAEVCIANGIADNTRIKRIINESEGDFRRVKRLVFAELKKQQKQLQD